MLGCENSSYKIEKHLLQFRPQPMRSERDVHLHGEILPTIGAPNDVRPHCSPDIGLPASGGGAGEGAGEQLILRVAIYAAICVFLLSFGGHGQHARDRGHF